MTGIEMLRDVCKALKGSPWFITDIATIGGEPAYEKLRKIADQIECEIEEAVADEVADTLSAYEMNINARWYSAVEDGADSDCKNEYEMINRYWLPRPRFDDGEPVQFGDEYMSIQDVHKVKGICVRADGSFEIESVGGVCYRYGEDERLKRLEPPDTWEKLAADIEDCDGSACRYFGRIEEEGRAPCSGCKAYNDETDCTVQVMSDLVRRAKKLAGIEEE